MGAAKVVVKGREELADVFVGIVGRTLAGKDPRDTCTMAVPGGSVAEVFFPALRRSRLDQSRLQVFWCDERNVPLNSPQSNYQLAHDLWLDPGGPPKKNVHAMTTNGLAIEEAAAVYEAILRAQLGSSLDITLLGVGSDGHVASLFPSHASLRESQRWVLPIDDSPKPPRERLTMTLLLLAQAECTVVAAFGAEKARVMREAIGDPSSQLPVALLLRAAHNSVVLLDEEAASGYSI